MNHSSGSSILLRKVRACAGKYFGTNEERKEYQRRAWNMSARHHGAAAFVTISPDDSSSATVAFYAGYINVDPLRSIKLSDVPSHSTRIEIAGKNSFACSLFFSNMLDLFIKHILGFDMHRKRSYLNGGALGVVKAFCWGY